MKPPDVIYLQWYGCDERATEKIAALQDYPNAQFQVERLGFHGERGVKIFI